MGAFMVFGLPSDRDLRAELDDAVGRQAIEPRGRERVGGKLHVKPGAETPERGMCRWHQRLPTDEERRVIDIDREAERTRALEREWYIWRFEEPMMHRHTEETLAELLHLDALFGLHEGRVVDRDMGEDHALMQHAIVLQIVQQRGRYDIGARVEEHGRAGDAHRRLIGALEEEIERHGFVAHDLLMMTPAVAPRFHDEEDRAGVIIRRA